MGGAGSGRQKGMSSRHGAECSNQYKKFKEWREQYGPFVPYPMKQKDGTIVEVMELPKRKKRMKMKYKTRKDKGKPQGKKSKFADDIGIYEPITFMELQSDLAQTMKDIAAFEELEAIREHESTPKMIQRKKDIKRDQNHDRYQRNHVSRRMLQIKHSGKCLLCYKIPQKSAQWVIVEFANELRRGICKQCYFDLLFKRFENSVERLRAFLKCIEYDKIKEVKE